MVPSVVSQEVIVRDIAIAEKLNELASYYRLLRPLK